MTDHAAFMAQVTEQWNREDRTVSTKTGNHLLNESIRAVNNLVIYVAEHPDSLPQWAVSAIENADINLNGVQDGLTERTGQ